MPECADPVRSSSKPVRSGRTAVRRLAGCGWYQSSLHDCRDPVTAERRNNKHKSYISNTECAVNLYHARVACEQAYVSNCVLVLHTSAAALASSLHETDVTHRLMSLKPVLLYRCYGNEKRQCSCPILEVQSHVRHRSSDLQPSSMSCLSFKKQPLLTS